MSFRCRSSDDLNRFYFFVSDLVLSGLVDAIHKEIRLILNRDIMWDFDCCLYKLAWLLFVRWKIMPPLKEAGGENLAPSFKCRFPVHFPRQQHFFAHRIKCKVLHPFTRCILETAPVLGNLHHGFPVIGNKAPYHLHNLKSWRSDSGFK